MSETPASSRVIIIMPAYNAERTLKATIDALPAEYRDIIICDDASGDGTYDLAKQFGFVALRHKNNRGYGGNQKTLFAAALSRGAEFVVMVHPDNQYDTACIPQMISLLEENSRMGLVLGSRMEHALEDQMPRWKYVGNRFLTLCENIVFGTDLPEFHTGLRAYRASCLKKMPYEKFSEGFVYDTETIAWFLANGFEIGTVPTRCRYAPESSSLGFRGSVRYGALTLWTLVKYAAGHYTDAI